MSVYKRGKYWIVQFNHANRTYTRSSKSTRKRDALELERQMRQQIVDTHVLGHREHIKLFQACDDLLATSKESGHMAPWSQQQIDSRITLTIFPWIRSPTVIYPAGWSSNVNVESRTSQFVYGPASSTRSVGMPNVSVTTLRNTNGASGISRKSQSVI